MLIMEYYGEYMLYSTYTLRSLEYSESGTTYFMVCDENYGIDARLLGNIGRFINHSWKPNVRTYKRVIAGVTRMFLVSLKEICVGEELTYNYGTIPFECKCLRA